jgi:hypothetical protein
VSSTSRYHDIGGLELGADFVSIDRKERSLFHWERQCAAMRVLLGAKELVPLDELRHTFETFGEKLYNELSFFERMLTSMLIILETKNVVSSVELNTTVASLKKRWQTDPGWLHQALDRSNDPCAPVPGQVIDPYGGLGYLPVAEAPPSQAEWRTLALAQILVDKGVLSFDGIRLAVERIDAPEPAWGARIVARAWLDDEFRQAILEDGRAACDAFGISFLDGRLAIVESTEDVHCLIVCTLCSCYPRNLLGQPPAWYVGKAYRSRAIREPRAVLMEFGVEIPQATRVDVFDSTADLRYMVLPRRPEGTQGWDETALAATVTRDCLIGVAVPQR